MHGKYGSEIRQRRLALNITQIQFARAIGRSQAWVAQLENLQLSASEGNRRKIEAFLRERERVLIPRATPRRSAVAP